MSESVKGISLNPKKEIEKLIKAALKKVQHGISEIEKESQKNLHVVEKQAMKGLHIAGKEIKKDLNIAGKEIKKDFEIVKDGIEQGFEQAFMALINRGLQEIIDDLIDVIQAKIFTGPIYVKLWWFGFHIDPDTKVDVLQSIAHNLPKSKKEIEQRLLQLIEGDTLTFQPEIPMIASFGGTITVDKIEEALEFVAKKLGLK